MSSTKDRKPLTHDELEETPGDPLPERAAMSLIGSHSITSAGSIPLGDVDPPSESEPLEDPSTGPSPDEE